MEMVTREREYYNLGSRKYIVFRYCHNTGLVEETATNTSYFPYDFVKVQLGTK